MTLAAPNRVAKTYFGSQIWLRSLGFCPVYSASNIESAIYSIEENIHYLSKIWGQ